MGGFTFDKDNNRIDIYESGDDLQGIFRNLTYSFDSFHRRIEYLRKENEKLKAENYKDEELNRMIKELAETKADLYRGFPISKEESDAVNNWQRQHNDNIHGKGYTGGAIGGSFSYHFVPTSIGTIGYCRCSSCYDRARNLARIEADNLEGVKFRNILEEKVKEADAEFVFQEL